ncbi:hypothetical protein PUNSTDRAFT_129390 [Punctularia strigosozonata HHB-11173 SS5]|uniref:uncharacterized protein n=1 Tax=Punctularia strigosozonata (strain HHB-11173) TaxID=741275 RepID=UPI00044179BE|nr:uncharacterized protein PUNSTDRAFT_129390 [Punctularia strigosozonata HHB-11173 SS5]EIN13716.1 hypothetical protein PUNSTDRAFT_129390 [Punctularia strigosozonata HHB-11173 SS5]
MRSFTNLSLLVTSVLSGVIVAFVPGVSAISAHGVSPEHIHRRHAGSARLNEVIRGDNADWAPNRRDSNARFTLYEAGLGACGGYNTDSDFIVAINTPQWDGGSHCGATITISYGGKTAKAQIVDRCEKCPYNALDLTPSLFSYFADIGQGVFYGDWWYGDSTQSTTTHKPSTTSQPPPPPSTTKTTTSKSIPSTTSTSTSSSTITTHKTTSSTSTTTSSWSTSIVTSISAITSSVASTTSLASATALPSPDSSSFMEQLDYLMVQLGGLALAGLTAADETITNTQITGA